MRTRTVPVACVSALLVAGGFAAVSAKGGASPWEAGPGKVSCLLVVEADSFLCLPCLDRLLDFARAVPPGSDRVSLWAVVVFDPARPGTDDARRKTLIARRATAAFRAHGLEWPIVVDDAAKWRALAPPPATLLVLEERTRRSWTYPLPLTPSSEDELLGLIKGEAKHD